MEIPVRDQVYGWLELKYSNKIETLRRSWGTDGKNKVLNDTFKVLESAYSGEFGTEAELQSQAYIVFEAELKHFYEMRNAE